MRMRQLAAGVLLASIAAAPVGAGGGRRPVWQCATIISEPGGYEVTRNLTCAGRAVTITAAGATLDLNGHTLRSLSTTEPVVAIEPPPGGGGSAHATVMNGTLRGGLDGGVTRGASSRGNWVRVFVEQALRNCFRSEPLSGASPKAIQINLSGCSAPGGAAVNVAALAGTPATHMNIEDFIATEVTTRALDAFNVTGRIENVQVEVQGTEPAISIVNARNLSLEDILAKGGGFALINMSSGVIRSASVRDAVAPHPGLRLDPMSTHNTVSRVQVNSGGSHGVVVQGPNNDLSSVQTLGNTGIGLHIQGNRNTVRDSSSSNNGGGNFVDAGLDTWLSGNCFAPF